MISVELDLPVAGRLHSEEDGVIKRHDQESKFAYFIFLKIFSPSLVVIYCIGCYNEFLVTEK